MALGGTFTTTTPPTAAARPAIQSEKSVQKFEPDCSRQLTQPCIYQEEEEEWHRKLVPLSPAGADAGSKYYYDLRCHPQGQQQVHLEGEEARNDILLESPNIQHKQEGLPCNRGTASPLCQLNEEPNMMIICRNVCMYVCM